MTLADADSAPSDAGAPSGMTIDLTVPASAANLGPGFDSVGLALGVLDGYRVRCLETPGLVVDLGPDAQGVPADDRHLVVSTMRRTWEVLGVTPPAGLELVCRNTIRMGRGMGSSAAAIVAGVALASALIAPTVAAGADVPLDLDFVNDLAGYLEGHPDNSSASVYGGATISYVEEAAVSDRALPSVRTTRLPLHPDIEPTMFVPSVQLPTATARAVLPEVVPHRDAALNSARAGLLTYALTHDPSLLPAATREWLHQEQRRLAYPDAMRLVDDLRAQGCAAVISGAGPSVLVLTTADGARDLNVPVRLEGAWEIIRPGVAHSGVRAMRATLEPSPEQRTVAL